MPAWALDQQSRVFFPYGGKWLRQNHYRFLPTVIVDEYRTSQTCAYCVMQVYRPKSANGNASRGACMCINPHCISFKHGRSISGRDTMAAANIAIKGFAATQEISIPSMDRHAGSHLASKMTPP